MILRVRRTVDDHLVVVRDEEIDTHIELGEAMRHDLPWDAPDLDDALDAAAGAPVEVVVVDRPHDPAQRAMRLTLDLLARRKDRGCEDRIVVRSES